MATLSQALSAILYIETKRAIASRSIFIHIFAGVNVVDRCLLYCYAICTKIKTNCSSFFPNTIFDLLKVVDVPTRLAGCISDGLCKSGPYSITSSLNNNPLKNFQYLFLFFLIPATCRSVNTTFFFFFSRRLQITWTFPTNDSRVHGYLSALSDVKSALSKVKRKYTPKSNSLTSAAEMKAFYSICSKIKKNKNMRKLERTS